MTRNGGADLEFRCEEDGDRRLLGVEAGAVKLAVVVPDGVPRAKLETAAADWVRELAHYVETSDGRESEWSDGRGEERSGGRTAEQSNGREEEPSGGRVRASGGRERPAGEERPASEKR